MTPSSQNEVRIIYSASPADRARVRRAGGRPRSAHNRLAVATCLMNLLIAGGLCYAVWWPIKANVWAVAVMKTPVEMTPGQMDTVGALFGARPSRRERTRPPKPPSDVPGPAITGQSAQTLIWATAGGWISLMSLACVMLSASAGAIIGGAGHSGTKRTFAGVAILGILGLAGGSAYVVWQYGMAFPSSSLRWGIAGLVGLGFFAAAWRAKSGRRLTRLASVSLLLASTGSAAALYLGHLCGIEPVALIPESSQAFLSSVTGAFRPITAIITLGAALVAMLLYAAVMWVSAKRL